jgi:hypothetical protein
MVGLFLCLKIHKMIDKEKYNKGIQEIIDTLEELKIGPTHMREDNRVTCLGGVALMVEDLAEKTEYEMAIPKLGVKPIDWKSQKQLEEY